jgi:hypothetical protein
MYCPIGGFILLRTSFLSFEYLFKSNRFLTAFPTAASFAPPHRRYSICFLDSTAMNGERFFCYFCLLLLKPLAFSHWPFKLTYKLTAKSNFSEKIFDFGKDIRCCCTYRGSFSYPCTSVSMLQPEIVRFCF